MKLETTSRHDARQAGLATFFTGLPCRNNHVSPRRVSNGVCVGCAEAWKASNKPHASRLMRAGSGKTKTRTIEVHVEDETYELAADIKDRLKTLLGRPVSGSILHRSGLKLLADRLDHTTDPRTALELVA